MSALPKADVRYEREHEFSLHDQELQLGARLS